MRTQQNTIRNPTLERTVEKSASTPEDKKNEGLTNLVPTIHHPLISQANIIYNATMTNSEQLQVPLIVFVKMTHNDNMDDLSEIALGGDLDSSSASETDCCRMQNDYRGKMKDGFFQSRWQSEPLLDCCDLHAPKKPQRLQRSKSNGDVAPRLPRSTGLLKRNSMGPPRRPTRSRTRKQVFSQAA